MNEIETTKQTLTKKEAKDLLKNKDLMVKGSGEVIRTTGNYVYVDSIDVFLVETEDGRIHIEHEACKQLKSDYIFKNSMAITWDTLAQDLEFVNRTRSSDFVSSGCGDEESSFSSEVEKFLENNEHRLSSGVQKNILTDGGITDTRGISESLFDLNEPKTVQYSTGKLIKRLNLDLATLKKLNSDKKLCDEFFSNINLELKNKGAFDVSFSDPSGDPYVKRHYPFRKYCEIRAVGAVRNE